MTAVYPGPPPMVATTPTPFATPSPPSPSSPTHPDQLSRLIRLAYTCEHNALLETMIGLVKGLMSSTHSTTTIGVSSSSARYDLRGGLTPLGYAFLTMQLSDELISVGGPSKALKALRGLAYLEVLMKGDVVSVSGSRNEQDAHGESDSPSMNTSSVLTSTTPHQRLRLLTGYYRLTKTWENLRGNPPTFEHAPSCGVTWNQNQRGCQQSWGEFWKDGTRDWVGCGAPIAANLGMYFGGSGGGGNGNGMATGAGLGLGLADIIGRLKAVNREYEKWGTASYMHHDCRARAKKAIADTLKEVEDELDGYFDVGF